jgi:hypothetical protein
VAEETWREIEAGEHDWSKLALWRRPDQVLERCRTERDLAIAHGREDLYEAPESTAKRRRKRRRQMEIALRDSDDDGD